jgi:SAM-dependent methyltransferase
MPTLKSYTSKGANTREFLAQMLGLYRWYLGNVPTMAAADIAYVREMEARVARRYNREIRALDLLEIGPGQFLSQAVYFARSNRVTAIDLDVIPVGFDPGPYLRMLGINGLRRTIKTLARKAAGIDWRYASEVKRQLNMEKLPTVTLQQMDICRTTFADESFDFAYSRSVFHHLPDPEAAMDEIARLLRPRGIAYVALHLYSSPTGSLNPSVLNGNIEELGRWAHLRPQLQDTVRPTVHLNGLRLREWRRLFAKHWPGCEAETTASPNEALEATARLLQSQGELRGYTMEELLHHELVVMWQKNLENDRG